MKKFIFLMVSAVAILALGGCGGSDYYDEEKYHIVDQNEFGVANIKYTCGETVEYTDSSGGFYFYSGDVCTLRLNIAAENSIVELGVDSRVDDLFIEDNSGKGINGIYYNCDSGKFGRTERDIHTDKDGHFDFDNVYKDDYCTFHL